MRKPFHRRLTLLLVLTGLVPLKLQAADENAGVKAYLAAKGLSPQGMLWVSSHEARLRKRLEGLDGLEKRHQAARQTADAMLQKNELIRAQLAAAEAAAQREAARKNPNPPPPVNADKAVKPPPGKLHSSLPDVTAIGEQSPLQLAMIELVSARSALALAVLAAERGLAELEQEYRDLAADERVSNALKQLGPKHRLGPGKGLDREPPRLAALAEQALTDVSPVYFELQRFRFGAILNEQTPATFSYVEGNEPVLITQSLAQILNLRLPDTAPKKVHRIGNRMLSTQETTLKQLRIGGHVFTRVAALVLPPEAEDLGCQLGTSGLGAIHAELAPQQMTLTLRD